MTINIANDALRALVLEKLKKEFEFIKLDKDYSIHFSLIDEKKYQLELMNDKKDKTKFMKEDIYDSKKGFKNLNYNIELLKNYIDDKYLLENFVSVATPINCNDGEDRNEMYGYDAERCTSELRDVYDIFGSTFIEDMSLELKNYNYGAASPLYFDFYGNKVRLVIEDNKKRKSNFIFFNASEVHEADIRDIILELDKNIGPE